jgi:hypothetical protein
LLWYILPQPVHRAFVPALDVVDLIVQADGHEVSAVVSQAYIATSVCEG